MLLGAQPITWAASLATAVFLPQFLGDRALGQYALASTIALLASIATTFGVVRYVTREVAADRTRAATYAPSAMVLMTVLGAGVALFLSIVLPLVGLFPTAPHLIAIALIGMVVSKPAHLLAGVLHGEERFPRLAAFNAVTGVAGAALGIGLLALGGGVGAYIAVLGAVSAAAGVVLWRLSGFTLNRLVVNRATLTMLLAGGAPFLGWSLVLRVYAEVDKILLAFLSTEAAIGWYAASYRFDSALLPDHPHDAPTARPHGERD